MRRWTPSSTLPCVVLVFVVLVLWSVLAGEISVPSIVTGLAVAIAAAAWSPLVDG